MTEALTAVEAEAKYGIPRHRIWLWKSAGKVTPVVPAQADRFPLDRIQELNRAANADKRSKHGR